MRFDPQDPMPRYNLACALARLGLKNRAIEQLAQIAKAKCKKCRARIERAKVDTDLFNLRNDPRFRALIK